MRRAKIVATLGPATADQASIELLIGAGADVLRLNAAHAGPDELASRLATARAASARAGKEVGILVDLAGPKVRIGRMQEGAALHAGDVFVLASGDCVGDSRRACVSYEGLGRDLNPDDDVLLDDGRIKLSVESSAAGEVRTRVVSGGPLLSGKGVNVPGVTLSVESVTDYDLEVLEWAMGADVDWIGQSFVRAADDVVALRARMIARTIPIMAKIEKHEAVAHIDEIVSAADGVMVARGDLAVETAPEQVPVLQRRIVEAARDSGRPVVVATEMLDSMRERPTPTRAEASDVANAIFSSADAVMLSAETAVGAYPMEAVSTMARIVGVAESEPATASAPRASKHLDDVQQAVSAAVRDLSDDLSLAAIVTITQSGATASAVSRFRPKAPIIAATPRLATARRLAVVWGVSSVVVDFADDVSDLLEEVVTKVREAGFVRGGDRIALTAGLSARSVGGTDFIHVKTV